MFKYLELISRLKHLPRKGWVLNNITTPETVASHMYRMAMCILLLPPQYDSNKLIKMALVHDLAESIVGDITPADRIPALEKKTMEENAMKDIVSLIPEWNRLFVMDLWKEYEDSVTPDAIIVKDLDIFDMILQAFEYEKMYKIDLGSFFQGLYLFRTEIVQGWAEEVYLQRENYHKDALNATLIET